MARSARIALVLGAALTAACGATSGFGLTSIDNDPDQLAQAFTRHVSPTKGAVVNKTGKPMAFLAVRPNKKKNLPQKLIAFDLAGKKELWRVETDVKSRAIVGRDFVAHRDGTGAMVARDVTTGAEMWRADVGDFLGASSDGDNLYYVNQDKSGAKPVWTLVAVDGLTGAELWRSDAPGLLGTPRAQGGLVFSPFLKQWLAILDAKTGKQLARIRGIDEEIAFIRTTSDAIYFGSKAGVFLMDDLAAYGTRGQSTYGRAKLPEKFVRGHYHWDAFDVIQSQYSAYDRNRLLWRGTGKDGEFLFADDIVIVHTYRFFFAFDANTGEMRWAYNNPRIDMIGSSHVGEVVAFCSGLGDIGALDPKTGQRRYTAKVDEQLVGVTFDAEGWSPKEKGERTSTVGALTSIARDRDARFNDVKQFSLTALASLSGAEVTRDLVELIQNERTPPKLYEKAVEVLISRKEADGLIYLIEALNVPYDFIAGTRPRATGVIAQAIGALGTDDKLDPAQRGAAVDALLVQLNAPETPPKDLVEIVKALGTMGGGAEIKPLRRFLLAYRGDPAFASQTAPISAAIDVLIERGGAAERELVGFLADDPRTQKSIAEYARRALLQTETPPAKQ